MIVFFVFLGVFTFCDTHHAVGHDGDDDDPLEGRPGDEPDEEAPGGHRHEVAATFQDMTRFQLVSYFFQNF